MGKAFGNFIVSRVSALCRDLTVIAGPWGIADLDSSGYDHLYY